MDRASDETLASLRRHLIASAVGVAALVFGVAGWAANAEFSGAVIAPGTLVVESDVKKIQHPTGGVVRELLVREGDRVAAGDVLLRLDGAVIRANYAVVSKALDEAQARKARLDAERDGADTPSFPAALLSRLADPEVSALVEAERRQFESRRTGRDGLRAQMRERIKQLEEQTQGMGVQLAANQREIDILTKELADTQALRDRDLVPVQRVNALERDLARAEGERGTLIAGIAQARAKISETELQILQIEQDLRAEATAASADARAEIAELTERKAAAEDELSRLEMRAPQSGVVHEVAIHTIGGVVSPGEPVMLIVPDDDILAVEARIPTRSIDQVHAGQPVALRFTAFDQRDTPELKAELTRVAADQSIDRATGQGYYTASA